MQIELFVPGIPAGAGSKKGFYIKKINKVIMSPASKKTKPWMESVRWAAIQAGYNGKLLLTKPVHLQLTFYYHRPKGHYGTGKNAGNLKGSAPKHKTTQPDLCKLVRAVEDALTGLVWEDDRQIVVHKNAKTYCERHEKAGVRIIITEIEF